MKCEEIREQLPDYWTGAIDEAARGEMDAHMAVCPACRAEAQTLGAIWKKLGALPEERPGRDMRARFEATLEAYVQGLRQAERGPAARERLDKWLEGWWPRQPAFQFGFAVVFLAIGLLAGHSLQFGGQNEGEITRLRDEVHNTRQLVALSLLQQQSASERLKGVDWSQRLGRPDPQVIAALLHTVNSDQNVNVRLAALDALRQASSNDTVRHGLIQSLDRQTSPLVQIAVIDALVELREKEAAEALKGLSREAGLNPEVKERAQWALGQLQ
ncbi:MAG TPA: HEAT repeat domain-containing protein [Bryobacteraceae bacterium]|nr:HEAT repeat domain-containing protein [Bryobacteraceae bacterium]